VDTSTSVLNCGSCGNACGAGQACTGGSCGCPTAGQTACPTGCVDLQSDSNNCGSCGKSCGGSATCNAGQCDCGGLTDCNGVCADLNSDTANCGACGKACSGGLTCNGGQCGCNSTASVSFAGQIQPIFTSNCAGFGCHTGVKPAGNMNLSAGKAYGSLVNVATSDCSGSKKRVVPGDPTQSYIMNKLTGQGICTGTKMPKIGSISQASINDISNWICAGAPNN